MKKIGLKFIKPFSCSTQMNTFILLINVKMPTIFGLLTFISIVNTTHGKLTVHSRYLGLMIPLTVD